MRTPEDTGSDLWHVSAAHWTGWSLKASPSIASCNAAEMSIAGK